MTGNFTYTNVGYEDTTPTDYPIHNDIVYGSYDECDLHSYSSIREDLKKIKEIQKREQLEYLKKCWHSNIVKKPIKPQRPDIQLRGVNFDGRGWA